MKNTTIDTMSYVEYIRENKQYIKIGIQKYNQQFDIKIGQINNLLQCNILSTSLEQLQRKIDEMNGVDYIDIIDKISILGENISAIVSEEKNPMLPIMNKLFEEER